MMDGVVAGRAKPRRGSVVYERTTSARRAHVSSCTPYILYVVGGGRLPDGIIGGGEGTQDGPFANTTIQIPACRRDSMSRTWTGLGC
jgi:hypothetical protein